MSSTPPAYGSGLGKQPDEHTKDQSQERTDSLADPEDPHSTITSLPNFSISPPDSPPFLENREKPDSPPGENDGSTPKLRYGGLRYSDDMSGGSYKRAGLGLTEKPPGSVTRARAEAQRRLQEKKTQQRQVDTGERAYPPPRYASNESDITPAQFERVMDKLARDQAGIRSIPRKDGGKWRCCKCNRGHKIYTYAYGPHPITVLSCECTHRSCSKCKLEGLVKHFVPMSEPEVVHLSEDSTKAMRFGVFCEGCGVSWRAEKVQEEVQKTTTTVKSALSRVSALPKRLRSGPHPLERLRSSRSMNNLHDNTVSRPHAATLTASKSVLNLRVLSREMKKEHGEQVEPVSVKFAGITCTCGMITAASSLCFQIVDPPKDFNKVQFAKQVVARKPAGFGSTPADQARGHGTPTLTLRGRSHPNPLRSNPVD
jgi:hypothetical protein